jgi:hypothetical protein
VCTLVSARDVLLFLKVRDCENHPLVQKCWESSPPSKLGDVHELGPREGTMIFLREIHGATNKTGPSFQPFFPLSRNWKHDLDFWHQILMVGSRDLLWKNWDRIGIPGSGKKKQKKAKARKLPFNSLQGFRKKIIAGYKMETLQDVSFSRKTCLLSVGFMIHIPLEATIWLWSNLPWKLLEFCEFWASERENCWVGH